MGWVLRTMVYTGGGGGGLRPIGVPFSGFTYIEGKGFHKLRYMR